VTEELAVASRLSTVSQLFFHQGIFDQKHDCRPYSPNFSVSPIEDKTEKAPF
jgi:hypothetical protein